MGPIISSAALPFSKCLPLPSSSTAWLALALPRSFLCNRYGSLRLQKRPGHIQGDKRYANPHLDLETSSQLPCVVVHTCNSSSQGDRVKAMRISRSCSNYTVSLRRVWDSQYPVSKKKSSLETECESLMQMEKWRKRQRNKLRNH